MSPESPPARRLRCDKLERELVLRSHRGYHAVEQEIAEPHAALSTSQQPVFAEPAAVDEETQAAERFSFERRARDGLEHERMRAVFVALLGFERLRLQQPVSAQR